MRMRLVSVHLKDPHYRHINSALTGSLFMQGIDLEAELGVELDKDDDEEEEEEEQGKKCCSLFVCACSKRAAVALADWSCSLIAEEAEPAPKPAAAAAPKPAAEPEKQLSKKVMHCQCSKCSLLHHCPLTVDCHQLCRR